MFAKKSLGQNFLNSPHAIQDIVEAGEIKDGDSILEIGPGKGALTSALLKTRAHVFAIEKDDRMIPFLQEKFAQEISNNKLTLIHGDVLEMEIKSIIPSSYKLIANIPYYITGEIMRRFFEEDHQPELMVLMVQKEVADRIVSRDQKESVLSISVKIFGEPKYIRTVKASAFIPAPNVDSAVLQIKNISKKFFQENNIDERKFFELLKAGFAHKRKFLSKNLEDAAPKERIEKAFGSIGIDAKARAEDLSVSNWKQLVKEILG